jgi:hypothetical protein
VAFTVTIPIWFLWGCGLVAAAIVLFFAWLGFAFFLAMRDFRIF